MTVHKDGAHRARPSAADEIRVLAPTAILGYGFPESSFAAGLAFDPDVIAVDAGSSDPGPYYLGAGRSFTDRELVKRDLTLMLTAARARRIPLVIGSAGGAGAAPHLAWTRDIILEIARERGLSFRLAVIASDVDRERVREALTSGAARPLGFDRTTTPAAIDESTHIVAQIGMSPFIEALDEGADVVLAGRSYDPAVFAAVPVWRGFDSGLALHLGKILECAAIACTPGSGSDCMLGILRRDDFLVRPLSSERRCTVDSIAAHSLYEKADPFHHYGPGGVLDLSQTKFEQIDETTVRVSGSVYRPAADTVKIEGARLIGFRTISIAGVRDPTMIASVDAVLAAVARKVSVQFGEPGTATYRLLFHTYGRNAVLGAIEPSRSTAHELGLVIEAVAATQATASAVCSMARSTLLHYGYEGRVATAGNLAFPFSPSDVATGEVYEFSLYHVMPLAGHLPAFQPRYETVGAAELAGIDA
jgi:hypothetical protein